MPTKHTHTYIVNSKSISKRVLPCSKTCQTLRVRTGAVVGVPEGRRVGRVGWSKEKRERAGGGWRERVFVRQEGGVRQRSVKRKK